MCLGPRVTTIFYFYFYHTVNLLIIMLLCVGDFTINFMNISAILPMFPMYIFMRSEIFNAVKYWK